ncbi:MAG: TRAP-type mannitol/chloroaromatic compound transport system substrate-binding protein [Candidatus Latescibacterota bacterium]|jgi:TRAP-type mannitol/chloroaromatic compound transport system substrate-binding protein
MIENSRASRRHFIKKASLASAAALVACGNAQEPSAPAVQTRRHFKWKMVTAWPKNFPGLGTGANHLAKSIGEMSGGQLEIKIYGAGELVPALGVFDAVSGGTAEMGHAGAYYWKGKHEATQFFSAVPFGLSAQEMNGWLRYGGGQELWDELYAPFGLKPFPVGNTGVQMGGWFNREINEVGDFSGLIMRMPGLGGEVLRRLDATVQTLPGGEIFQALKTGAIDATEWVGPYNDLAFGFHQAAKYYYWPGWHEPGTTMEGMINKEAWDALPTDLQHLVRYACQAANEDMLAEFTARNNTALTTLVEKHGVQLRRFSDEVLKEIGRISTAVVAEIADKDPMSKKIYDSFARFRRESISYTRISEEAYTQARALTFG